jgi:MFS family permease
MKRIYYGWWVVGGAFLLLFCSMGTHLYAFPVFFDVMVREMEWARTQVALALAVGTFVLGVVGLFVGGLIRRFGLRPVVVCGALIAGLGFLLLTTVNEPWQFYLYYGLILSAGIAGMETVPTMTAVEAWFARGKSTALGIATAGMGVGGLVMAPLAGWLISRYDWQTAFAFMAGIVMLIGIPVGVVAMRTPGLPSAAPRQVTQQGLEASDFTTRQVLRQQSFWLVSIGSMLWLWAYLIALTHQVAFAVDIGMDRVAASGAVGLLCAFSIPGRLGFGKLGDIMDKRHVMIIAAGLQISALIILLKTTNLTMLYVYSCLIGISIGGLTPILPGILADYFGGRHFGTIYGASGMVVTLGLMIGPVYGGWIFDSTGSYYLAFLSGIVITLLAAVLVYLARKPRLQ